MRVNDYFKSKDINSCLFWYTSNRSIWNLTRIYNYTLHLDWTNKPCSTSADWPYMTWHPSLQIPLVASRLRRRCVAQGLPAHRPWSGKKLLFPIWQAKQASTGGSSNGQWENWTKMLRCFGRMRYSCFFFSRWHRYGKGSLVCPGGYNIPWRVLLEAWNSKPSP